MHAFICYANGNRFTVATTYSLAAISLNSTASSLATWSDARAAWNFRISQARRVNKTEDLFLRDSYLIPCKPYPKGLPLSVSPPVLERAALAAICIIAISHI